MPRFRSAPNISLSELTAMVSRRRRELTKLHEERRELQRDLDRLDRAIARIEGDGGRGHRGGRVRNDMSLVATMAQVLAKAGKPMAVSDIVQSVQQKGYRSGSANFRALVNMTLVKDDRFQGVSRGVYELKGQSAAQSKATRPKKRKRLRKNPASVAPAPSPPAAA